MVLGSALSCEFNQSTQQSLQQGLVLCHACLKNT